MSRGRQIVLFVAVALAALAAGVLFNPLSKSGGSGSGDIEPLLAARLPDLDGRSQAIGQWRGKVMVINFWATWCPPCLEEIPEFVRLQDSLGDRGLQFVGIAIDDVDKVRDFASRFQVNYPMLVGEFGAVELARVAGNKLGGLPFTVIVDRNGRLVRTELGGLNQEKLSAIVAPLL
jgi:thiol-disulfide isomerase/thioredoxin